MPHVKIRLSDEFQKAFPGTSGRSVCGIRHFRFEDVRVAPECLIEKLKAAKHQGITVLKVEEIGGVKKPAKKTKVKDNG